MYKVMLFLFVFFSFFSCQKDSEVLSATNKLTKYYFTCNINSIPYSINSNNGDYLEGFYIQPTQSIEDSWIDIYANLANVIPMGSLPPLKSYNFNIHMGLLNGNPLGTLSTLQSSSSLYTNNDKNYFVFYDTTYKEQGYGASIYPVLYLYPENFSNLNITITQLDSVIAGTFTGKIQSIWNANPPIVKNVTDGKFRVLRK
jgi:hypothetical protein